VGGVAVLPVVGDDDGRVDAVEAFGECGRFGAGRLADVLVVEVRVVDEDVDPAFVEVLGDGLRRTEDVDLDIALVGQAEDGRGVDAVVGERLSDEFWLRAVDVDGLLE